MDLSVLQLFVAVMRQGSFAAVARDRNIDPSSVSRAIATLEKELGIRLFQRTTRRLSPTEAGTTYFVQIEPLLEELLRARDLATDVSGQLRGQLRVTASVPFGLKCIVPLLPAFADLYPELSIDLRLTDAVVDLIAERIDIAVRLGILEDSTLIAQRLMQTHYRVCASPDYLQKSAPLKQPPDLEQHNCLRFPLAGFQTRWIFKDQAGDRSEIPVHGTLTIANMTALQHCALSGMGLALLPSWLVDEDLRAGTLVDVFPRYEVTATDFRTAAWLVYPSRTYVPLKVQVFIEFLKQSMVG